MKFRSSELNGERATITTRMPITFRWRGALVILVAVLVRVTLVVAVDTGKLRVEFNPDSYDYSSFAYNLASGVGFAHAIDEQRPFSRPVEFSAWRPPLYPAFLALVYRFSMRLLFLFLVNVVLAALALYLFLRLGLVLFGETAALIAGLGFALYPPLIMYSGDFGTESLFLVLLMAIFLTFYQPGKYRFGEQGSTLRILVLGALVGLAALCRPNGLMLAPSLVLAIWLTASDWKRAVRQIAVLTVAVALVVLPWTYRNYRLFHRVVLISTGGGAAFWSGAHFRLEPGASLRDIAFLHMLDSLPPSTRQNMQAIPEPAQEQQFYHWGFAILDHSPRRLALMAWRNFAAMYTLVPAGKYHSLRNRLLYSACYIPILVSGLVGFFLVRQRWKELSLFWAWMLTNTTLYCLYFATIRYRVPTIDPVLVLGAGVCLAGLLARYSGGNRSLA